jgi:hypothetical protein
MPITKMTEMWNRLDAYNLNGEGNERPVNHLNEWGGFSRLLEMPVFTAWFDQLEYDKSTKLTTALINDTNWARPVGVNNQERWIAVAEQAGGGIAAFFIIHAVDVNAERRVVRNIDDDKVFVGKLVRDGTATFIVGQPRFL